MIVAVNIFCLRQILFLIGKNVFIPQKVRADLTLHAPTLRWSHSGNFDSLDHASVR